jgi:diadenosine tetraphosphate (Ap4A) HIT family hydrolase/pimeloyl-ACP methyl ester carboxylesterase
VIPLVAPFIAACAALGAPAAKVPDAVVLGKPYDNQNAFAKAVRGQERQPVVYEDRSLVAFMDFSPASPGHVLVISKTSKARNLLEMKDADVIRLLHAARRIGRAEIAGLGADGFTVEQNNAYSQSVPHLHVHVIPRYAGYNRCISSGLRQPPPVLEQFAARIRGGLKADKGGPVPPHPRDNLPPLTAAPFTPQRALTSEPQDKDHPAAMAAFQLPSHGAKLNAVFYTASGAGPHPTLLLLHGFPGNEQNLDVAQAVRRTGWNVLTLHYRGSWGSEGDFSFAHCAEDAEAALAWLRDPANTAKYNIDTSRIVTAGHSMGGIMAAHAAVADRQVIGTILIDPWDTAASGRTFAADAKARQAFVEDEMRGDLPPLSGTSEAALLDEIMRVPPALDLVAAATTLADRPLLVIGAERGIAPMGKAAADAAQAAGGKAVTALTMPTDHSFSDRRLALTEAIVGWLGQFNR